MNRDINTFKYGADSNCRNVSDHNYDEEYALYVLDDNLDKALDYQCDMEDNYGVEPHDKITIIVNGVAHEFILGGPQSAGISKFIENVCEENLYESPIPERIHWEAKDEELTADELVFEVLKDMKQDADQPYSVFVLWAIAGLEDAMNKSVSMHYHDDDVQMLKAMNVALKLLTELKR